MSNKEVSVWIFHGSGGGFTSGVFSSIDKAEAWITKYKLTGLLTKYPVDESAFDHAVNNGWYEWTSEAQPEASFIQKFTSASQEHYRHEDGIRE